jgi:PEP-CTERM motif
MLSRERRMKRFWQCLGFALFVAFLTPIDRADARPNNPDAFVKTEMRSVEQLAQVAQSNPRVRRNFARHFGIPESQVANYFRRNLVLTRLKQSREVTVYAVTRTGRIYPVRERLRKGTQVFALRNGEPVLKGLCANPLVRRLPPMAMAPPRTPVIPRPPQVAAPPVITPPAPPETPLAPPTTTFLPPAPPETVVVPLPMPLESAPFVEAGPVPPPTTVRAVPPPGGRGFNPAWLLAGIPFFFINTGGDHETPPRPIGPPIIPPPVIPEPGTWVLLGAGLPVVGLALRRQRTAHSTQRTAHGPTKAPARR